MKFPQNVFAVLRSVCYCIRFFVIFTVATLRYRPIDRHRTFGNMPSIYFSRLGLFARGNLESATCGKACALGIGLRFSERRVEGYFVFHGSMQISSRHMALRLFSIQFFFYCALFHSRRSSASKIYDGLQFGMMECFLTFEFLTFGLLTIIWTINDGLLTMCRKCATISAVFFAVFRKATSWLLQIDTGNRSALSTRKIPFSESYTIGIRARVVLDRSFFPVQPH